MSGQVDVSQSAHRGRLVELDGLRSLAILPVMFHHCFPKDLSPFVTFLGNIGWLGVDLFFVLSGYLITGILVDSVGRDHFYRNFIVRRSLRIFPLYYACLVLFTVATRFAEKTPWGQIGSWGSVGWFVAYVGNIQIALQNALPPVFSFGVLWSLQVEEQFYLLYPFAVVLLSRRNLGYLLIGCVALAPALRTLLLFFVPGSECARWTLMPCRMDSLALGGLVALLMRTPMTSRITFPMVRNAALFAGLLLAACLSVSTESVSSIMSSIGFTLTATACALLLLLVVRWPSSRLCSWLRWRPLVYTGQLAYGLYMLHGPAGWAARAAIAKFWGIQIAPYSVLSVVTTFTAAFLVAELSWRFFESPILAFKEKFSS